MDDTERPPKATSIEEFFLTTVLDDLGAYVFTQDTQGVYTFANDALLELLCVELSDITGKNDAHFFDLSQSNISQASDERVLLQGETVKEEEMLTLKHSGKTVFFWTVKKPLRNEVGTIVGMYGLSIDITERKSLLKEKQLLDAILKNVDAYVYFKDSERRYHFVNDKVADAFALKPQDIIGKRDFDIMDAEEAAYVWEQDEKVITSNQRQEREESFVSLEGVRNHFWTISVPIQLEGRLPALVGISTDITELHNLKEELQRQATTDTLTGLNNRRHFFDVARREMARTKRYALQMTIMVIDIDFFKKVNDTYGHPVGDLVLVEVAAALQKTVRAEDTLARVGGEEFCILLPHTPTSPEKAREASERLAERLLHAVSSLRFTGEWEGELKTSISIGVSSYLCTDTEVDQIYSRADLALYEAKETGRNRVCVK